MDRHCSLLAGNSLISHTLQFSALNEPVKSEATELLQQEQQQQSTASADSNEDRTGSDMPPSPSLLPSTSAAAAEATAVDAEQQTTADVTATSIGHQNEPDMGDYTQLSPDEKQQLLALLAEHTPPETLEQMKQHGDLDHLFQDNKRNIQDFWRGEDDRSPDAAKPEGDQSAVLTSDETKRDPMTSSESTSDDQPPKVFKCRFKLTCDFEG